MANNVYLLLNVPLKKIEKGMVTYQSFKFMWPPLHSLKLIGLTHKGGLYGMANYSLGLLGTWELGKEDKHLLGLTNKQFETQKEKWESGKPLMIVHLHNFHLFKEPFIGLFEKPVRGLRFTTTTEKQNMDLAYVQSFEEEICTNPFKEEYDYWYSYFMEFEMIDAFFKYCNGERV